MVHSISIKNFKSVHELDIELGRVNIFIGENGCGKTSILEAIGMASAVISNKLDNEFLASRGIRVPSPRLMKSGFSKADGKNKISFKLTNAKEEFIQYHINYHNKDKVWEVEDVDSNPTIKVNATTQMVQRFAKILLENEDLKNKFTQQVKKKKSNASETKNEIENEPIINALEAMMSEYYSQKGRSTDSRVTRAEIISSHNIQIRKKYNFSNFLIFTPENYFLRRFEEEGQISPIGIRGEGLFRHLVQLFEENPTVIQEINNNLKLISWFDGLEIPNDLSFSEMRLNIKDRFIKDTINYFDQRSANEGFLYLLFYFTLFLSKETPEFFAIDNIDNALNPKLCRELIKRLITLAKKEVKQVILTTHNPAILDGLDLTDDTQRLFVVFRNADGQTKVKRVKAPQEIKGIETVRLSEAFIRGYIGGLPKNF